jgi:purine-binding chemotaxis protein CheW
MANALALTGATVPAATQREAQQEFVTLRLGAQLFGIAVSAVQDVMHAPKIAPVPLAPEVIAGVINVRGRIVTAFDMRRRMRLGPNPDPASMMLVVIHYEHDLFALMVDAVGDVLALPMNQFEKVPANIDDCWREVAAGVFKLEEELLVILDVVRIIRPGDAVI